MFDLDNGSEPALWMLCGLHVPSVGTTLDSGVGTVLEQLDFESSDCPIPCASGLACLEANDLSLGGLLWLDLCPQTGTPVDIWALRIFEHQTFEAKLEHLDEHLLGGRYQQRWLYEL